MVYRQMLGRAWILGFFALFAIVAVGLVAGTAATGEPPPLFMGFWLFALGWNAYWWLLRVAVSLAIEGESALVWETPLRSGRIPLSAIKKVRPMRFGSNVVVVEHSGGRPLLILASKGLRQFLDELARVRPDLEIRLGWQARLAEWLPGTETWRRRD